MREILFRGKRANNGEWVHGDLIKQSRIDPFTYIAKGFGYKIDDVEIGKPIKVLPDTVGQYTGLTDRNGKKIFEGDILKLTQKGGEINGVVVFENCGYFAEVDNDGLKQQAWLDGAIKKFKAVVIGNIHDQKD